MSLASIDVTESCLDVSTISRGTGYPYAAATQPSTAQVTLSDADGEFAPENANNFWTQQGGNQNATRTSVEIRAKNKVIFSGEVLEITQNITQATVVVKCTDLSRKLRTDKITDFGLEKAWRLVGGDAVGVYPLVAGTPPLSDDSVTVERANDDALNIVSKVKTSGVLDPNNIEVSDEAIISEGQWIDVDNPGTYPGITAKTPYRYKHVNTILTDILDHFAYADGAARSIETLSKSVNLYGAALGRIGYDAVLGNVGSGVYLNWHGVVTDVLYDAGDFYFAYSVNADATKFSQILKYDISEDAWSVVRTLLTASREIWGLAKIDNNLIMLITDGDYDSARSELEKRTSTDTLGVNETKLIYMDITETTPAINTLVDSDSEFPPQIAMLLQTGSHVMHISERSTYEPLPDTRRRLRVNGSTLYYPFAVTNADGDIRAGVASVEIGEDPASVLEFGSDGYNHAGFAFDFAGDDIVLGTTFIDDCNQSRLKIVKQT